MRYFFDLHLHSDRSFDSLLSPKLIFTRARELGLRGFAITDHDFLTRIQSPYDDILVIPGMELTIEDIHAHLLAVGIQDSVDLGLDINESIDMIHDLNGVAISPHTFSSKDGFPAIGDQIYDLETLDGIEVTSPRDHIDNLQARKVASTMNLAKVGGSDAHHPSEMGFGQTVTKQPVDSIDDLLSLIRKKKTDGLMKIVR